MLSPQAAGAKYMLVDTESCVEKAVGILTRYEGDQAVGVCAHFQQMGSGQERVAIFSVVLSSLGPPLSPRVMQPLLVMFQLSRMGWRLPFRLLTYLCRPGLLLVTFDWKAGGAQSLRSVLQQECESYGLLDVFQRQLLIDFMQAMGTTLWTTVLSGPLWNEPSCTADTSWMVGVLGFSWVIDVARASLHKAIIVCAWCCITCDI